MLIFLTSNLDLDLILGFPSLIDSVVDSDAEMSSQIPRLLNKIGALCTVGFDNLVLLPLGPLDFIISMYVYGV